MKLLDLTLPTPAENLACDEALLNQAEANGGEILRFWEPREHFVVVGYANKVGTEVDVAVEVEVTVDVTVEGAEGALTETATYPTAPTMTISTIIIAAITARATPNLFGLRFNCIFFLNLFNNRLAPHLSCHRFHNF